uniref:Uncharacterized protein n=1 Tax=Toxoplasma gondii COUG TaxID=1074873 RepID=A0A2G8Y359_TOXGO|nr:hypothetical protein TGCOUG_365070 [Toxoplasma gondii COUG]
MRHAPPFPSSNFSAESPSGHRAASPPPFSPASSSRIPSDRGFSRDSSAYAETLGGRHAIRLSMIFLMRFRCCSAFEREAMPRFEESKTPAKNLSEARGEHEQEGETGNAEEAACKEEGEKTKREEEEEEKEETEERGERKTRNEEEEKARRQLEEEEKEEKTERD